ncbi:hypothetical protein PN434_08255, partial [Microcystis aeruginosa CS-558/01A06]|nr:hypothetical protein [Microcystis aeruginosa CS-558/01A06]
QLATSPLPNFPTSPLPHFPNSTNQVLYQKFANFAVMCYTVTHQNRIEKRDFFNYQTFSQILWQLSQSQIILKEILS